MTFRPNKNFVAKNTNAGNSFLQETFPITILGYVSGADGINSYIVGASYDDPNRKFLIKTREQNKKDIDILQTNKNTPQKMRTTIGFFKAQWEYLLACCTDKKGVCNENMAKKRFSEEYLKMKTTAEPGSIVLCQGAYIDNSLKSTDLVDFSADNLNINFNMEFKSIKKNVDGSSAPDFSYKKVGEFISVDELKVLPILNVKKLKRLTREINESSGKIVKGGFLRLDAPKEKNVKINEQDVKKYDVALTFIDNKNAVEVKKGTQLKEKILQVLNMFQAEGGLNGAGVFVRMLIEDELNYIVSTNPSYVYSKQNEATKEWQLDDINNVVDEAYQGVIQNFFISEQSEDGEVEGFCENDFLSYPCEKLSTILKIEVVPIRVIKIPHYEQQGVNDYLLAREFFNKKDTTVDDYKAIKDNRYLNMNLNENLFKINNEKIPFGFIEGYIVFKTNELYISAFEEFYSKYFAGSPENSNAIKKYPGDPRFICCSRDLVPTNIITKQDIIKEARPNEYREAKMWAETSIKENEIIEANNKKYYDNKKINIVETQETILTESTFDDDDSDFDENLSKIQATLNSYDNNEVVDDD